MKLIEMLTEVLKRETDGVQTTSPATEEYCSEIEKNIWRLENMYPVCFTVLITPEPLTPIQSHYIQAILENKEFNSGRNK